MQYATCYQLLVVHRQTTGTKWGEGRAISDWLDADYHFPIANIWDLEEAFVVAGASAFADHYFRNLLEQSYDYYEDDSAPLEVRNHCFHTSFDFELHPVDDDSGPLTVEVELNLFPYLLPRQDATCGDYTHPIWFKASLRVDNMFQTAKWSPFPADGPYQYIDDYPLITHPVADTGRVATMMVIEPEIVPQEPLITFGSAMISVAPHPAVIWSEEPKRRRKRGCRGGRRQRERKAAQMQREMEPLVQEPEPTAQEPEPTAQEPLVQEPVPEPLIESVSRSWAAIVEEELAANDAPIASEAGADGSRTLTASEQDEFVAPRRKRGCRGGKRERERRAKKMLEPQTA